MLSGIRGCPKIFIIFYNLFLMQCDLPLSVNGNILVFFCYMILSDVLGVVDGTFLFSFPMGKLFSKPVEIFIWSHQE